MIPGTPWQNGWSWEENDHHNHWSLGEDGVPGIPGVDDDGDGEIDNLISSGPGELGIGGFLTDDVPLSWADSGDSNLKDWPRYLPIPPITSTIDGANGWEAYNAEHNDDTEAMEKDWGDPGKNHQTVGTYDD